MKKDLSVPLKLNIVASSAMAVVMLIEFIMGQFMMGFYAFSTILCFNILFLLMKIVKRSLKSWEIVLCQIFIIVAIYCSNRFDLYHRFWIFDIILHSFSGVILAIVLPVLFLRDETRETMTTLEYAIVCFFFALAAAGFWEIMEFFFDLIVKGDVQRNLTLERELFQSDWQNPGILDTMNDIINGTFGGIVGAILIYVDQKFGKNKQVRK